MSIAKPGRRLLTHVPLAFVARRAAGGAQRPLTSSLSLTSMIDFLVVTVVFLLIAFQPSESAAANGARLPEAINVEDAMDAPMIGVRGSLVMLDGEPAGNTRAVEGSNQLQPIDELSRALVANRETWRQLHPDRRFPGAVVLQLDQDVTSIVVKSLFLTATRAGYPAISFMVQKAER
jgi:hypothetical protein